VTDLIIQSGDTVVVQVDDPAPVVVDTAPGETVVLVAVPGIPGIPGPSGPAGANGVTEYHGLGSPPLTILGSHPGDLYIDDLTGDRYQQT